MSVKIALPLVCLYSWAGPKIYDSPTRESYQ